MTFDEMKAVLERVTFRPGWRFEFYRDPTGAAVFRCGTREPDSEQPGVTVDVFYTETLSPVRMGLLDQAGFLAWIREIVTARVAHEVDEWLRLDGRPFVEPHPEKGWSRGVLSVREVGAPSPVMPEPAPFRVQFR